MNIEKRIDIFSMLKPNSIVIELGVAKGLFSNELLETHKNISVLYSVDLWCDHHNQEEYLEAKKLLSTHNERSRIIRASFSNAVYFFEQEVDAVFFDGYAHTGQDEGKTFDQWFPKIKKGGIIAGHDYCKQFQPTIDSVDRFLEKHNLPLNLTKESGPMQFPSWWTIKE